MRTLSPEEILAMQCKNELSNKAAEELRKANIISVEEYNQLILSILRDQNEEIRPVFRTDCIIDETFKREIASKHVNDREMMESAIRMNIEKYYSIRDAPSYLYSGMMLSPDDIYTVLQIYSELYMLSPCFDSAIAPFIYECIQNHALNIIEKCKENPTVNRVYDAIREIKRFYNADGS